MHCIEFAKTWFCKVENTTTAITDETLKVIEAHSYTCRNFSTDLRQGLTTTTTHHWKMYSFPPAVRFSVDRHIHWNVIIAVVGHLQVAKATTKRQKTYLVLFWCSEDQQLKIQTICLDFRLATAVTVYRTRGWTWQFYWLLTVVLKRDEMMENEWARKSETN